VYTIVLNVVVYPAIMCWTWNLQGGFLSNLGFVDRGGCAVIFHTAGITGIIGAIVVGPRYGRFMAITEEKRIFSAQATKANDMMMMYQYKSEKDSSTITAQRINAINKQKNLAGMLDDAAKGNANLDDLYLRKIRKKIKHATVATGEDHDFYLIDNQLMILGTFITVIGWAMLNACGSGAHNMNTVSGRFQAESAFLNTFIAGSFSSIFSFLLKK
jgi:ammonia channel protein AmtB